MRYFLMILIAIFCLIILSLCKASSIDNDKDFEDYKKYNKDHKKEKL